MLCAFIIIIFIIITINQNVKVAIIQIHTCSRIEPQMLHNLIPTTATSHKQSTKDHADFE